MIDILILALAIISGLLILFSRNGKQVVIGAILFALTLLLYILSRWSELSIPDWIR